MFPSSLSLLPPQEVGFGYQGKRRYFGTYDSKDTATLVNKTGRKFLAATSAETGVRLSSEEAEWNVKQARGAALDAVREARFLVEQPAIFVRKRKSNQKPPQSIKKHRPLPKQGAGARKSGQTKVASPVDYRAVGVRKTHSGKWVSYNSSSTETNAS